MPDETEPYRRQRLVEINARPGSREALEAEHGRVWMAKQFLADNGNDLVSLAQILWHENLQTTSRHSQRNGEQLAEASERTTF
jgi:hypothetical protein